MGPRAGLDSRGTIAAATPPQSEHRLQTDNPNQEFPMVKLVLFLAIALVAPSFALAADPAPGAPAADSAGGEKKEKKAKKAKKADGEEKKAEEKK
jgi:hypothetical protein